MDEKSMMKNLCYILLLLLLLLLLSLFFEVKIETKSTKRLEKNKNDDEEMMCFKFLFDEVVNFIILLLFFKPFLCSLFLFSMKKEHT
jgi:hypothetical protein